MRLITLNSWCGRSLYPLMKFFRSHSADTDIFCLQEVYKAEPGVAEAKHPDEYVCGQLFNKITGELKNFNGSFAHYEEDLNRMSQAMFLGKNLSVKSVKDHLVYKPPVLKESGSIVFSPRKLQYVIIEVNGRDVLVVNYHGLWINGPKTDTPERIEQSRNIRKFIDSFDMPKIVCGDLNLLPDTESIKIIGEGMSNLIKEYKVESTRTPLYRHYLNPGEPNFADYIFVSPEIKINKFEVLPDLASDHAPLLLDFS